MTLEFPYNFHTHSTYCDGVTSLENMAAAACDLGFSGHLYIDGTSVSMSDEGIQAYKEDIAALQKTYAGRMNILCGAEADFWDNRDLSSFDYIIQSCHDFRFEGDDGYVYVPTDHTVDIVKDAVARYFGGDWYAANKHFFGLVAQIAKKDRVDIIGHFDYLTKYNGNGIFFDESDPRYVAAWQDALDALLPLGVPFEINTSGFYRGMRSCFYPAPPILKEIFRRGGSITFSGDVHDKNNLYKGFPEALAMAREIGFRQASIMTPNGPASVEI